MTSDPWQQLQDWANKNWLHLGTGWAKERLIEYFQCDRQPQSHLSFEQLKSLLLDYVYRCRRGKLVHWAGEETLHKGTGFADSEELAADFERDETLPPVHSYKELEDRFLDHVLKARLRYVRQRQVHQRQAKSRRPGPDLEDLKATESQIRFNNDDPIAGFQGGIKHLLDRTGGRESLTKNFENAFEALREVGNSARERGKAGTSYLELVALVFECGAAFVQAHAESAWRDARGIPLPAQVRRSTISEALERVKPFLTDSEGIDLRPAAQELCKEFEGHWLGRRSSPPVLTQKPLAKALDVTRDVFAQRLNRGRDDVRRHVHDAGRIVELFPFWSQIKTPKEEEGGS